MASIWAKLARYQMPGACLRHRQHARYMHRLHNVSFSAGFDEKQHIQHGGCVKGQRRSVKVMKRSCCSYHWLSLFRHLWSDLIVLTCRAKAIIVCWWFYVGSANIISLVMSKGEFTRGGLTPVDTRSAQSDFEVQFCCYTNHRVQFCQDFSECQSLNEWWMAGKHIYCIVYSINQNMLSLTFSRRWGQKYFTVVLVILGEH